MMSAMQRAHHPKKVEIYKHALYWFWFFFMIHWSGLCSIYWLIWGGYLDTPYSCLVNAFHWHKRFYWEHSQWSQVNFNRTIRNKFQWNLNQKSNISIWWNACGEQMSETRRQFMQVPRWGVKSELGGGGGGLSNANNELAQQIWRESDREFICKCREILWQIRGKEMTGIQWSITKC